MKAVAKAAPKAKAVAKAVPKAGAPKPPWATVTNGISARDRIQRNGILYYHARRIVGAMGLRSWESHLTGRIPMCRDEFGWVVGVDYYRRLAVTEASRLSGSVLRRLSQSTNVTLERLVVHVCSVQ